VFIATQHNSTQLNSTELNSGRRVVYDVINKNTTDLLRADWLYAVQLGQFNWVQLSWVELCRYKHPLTRLGQRSVLSYSAIFMVLSVHIKLSSVFLFSWLSLCVHYVLYSSCRFVFLTAIWTFLMCSVLSTLHYGDLIMFVFSLLWTKEIATDSSCELYWLQGPWCRTVTLRLFAQFKDLRWHSFS